MERNAVVAQRYRRGRQDAVDVEGDSFDFAEVECCFAHLVVSGVVDVSYVAYVTDVADVEEAERGEWYVSSIVSESRL